MSHEKTALKVENLANLFQIKMEKTPNWQVTLEEILETTGFDFNNYTQNLYTFDQSDFVSHLEKIDARNFGHFLHFLDQHYYKGSLKIFSNQGIFLTGSQRTDLSDYFFNQIIELSASHSIDYDSFSAMFSHFKSFGRAWECYEQEYFNPDEIKSQLLKKHSQDRPQSITQDFCVSHYLEQLFQRKVITLRPFLEEIIEKLFDYIFPEKTRTNFQQQRPSANRSHKTQDALSVLGFTGLPDLPTLKNRFKKLMKQFHPDINPKGLEKSKAINIAFQRILMIIKKGVIQNGE